MAEKYQLKIRDMIISQEEYNQFFVFLNTFLIYTETWFNFFSN